MYFNNKKFLGHHSFSTIAYLLSEFPNSCMSCAQCLLSLQLSSLKNMELRMYLRNYYRISKLKCLLS